MGQITARKFAKPTVDVVFKKVFCNPANEECLKSFLSALLERDFLNLEILNSAHFADKHDQKGGRLNILAELPNQQYIHIDMQIKDEKGAEKRSLHDWSELFSAQLGSGEPYHMLVPVVSIFVLGFALRKETDEYHHKFVLQEQKTHATFNHDKELLEIHFLELPKFQLPPEGIPLNTLEKWCLYFQTDSDEVLEELKRSDKVLFKAVSELELAQMNPAERRSYEARLAGLGDDNSPM